MNDHLTPTTMTGKLKAIMNNHSPVVRTIFPAVGDNIHTYIDAQGVLRIPEGTQEIVMGAFTDELAIFSVWFPDSVTMIGSEAFKGCSNLESVRFPRFFLEIHRAAFMSSGLECVKMTTCNVIGSSAFSGCRHLIRVQLPCNLKAIGEYAFDGCVRMETINIPRSLTVIGAYAFALTHSLDCVLTIPKNCDTSPGSFEECGACVLTTANGVPLSAQQVLNIGLGCFGNLTKSVQDLPLVREVLLEWAPTDQDTAPTEESVAILDQPLKKRRIILTLPPELVTMILGFVHTPISIVDTRFPRIRSINDNGIVPQNMWVQL